MALEAYKEHLLQTKTRLEQHLEWLLQPGTRTASMSQSETEWRDTTDEEIARYRKDIALYENLLATLEGKMPIS